MVRGRKAPPGFLGVGVGGVDEDFFSLAIVDVFFREFSDKKGD